MNTRLVAAQTLTDVIRHGKSLTTALSARAPQFDSPQEAALGQEVCYGVCRHYFALDAMAKRYVKKPLKAKDTDIWCLVLIGLYQIWHMQVPDYAAVDSVVTPAKKSKKPWAGALINGVLRNALRDHPNTTNHSDSTHPKWLTQALQKAYPSHASTILTENDARAPMTLRVNTRRCSRDDYLEKLVDANIPAKIGVISPDAIVLESPVSVSKLPGFDEGLVSVQDEAAQLAATVLSPPSGARVLDACAAPGGKTCHLLERFDVSLTSLDADPLRAQRIHDNLRRLKLQADVLIGEAQHLSWWNNEPFDAILLDVPCSATGVIRRHPDIKLLRQPEDIATLTQLQQEILENVWNLLATGGRMVYSTCSVLPDENTEQVRRFVTSHSDSELLPINAEWGMDTGWGRQIFPNDHQMDGFFYACLRKK